jgi:hypothetical protein
MKKIFFILCILAMTAASRGGGNVEIDDGKLIILSDDAAYWFEIYQEDTNSFVAWEQDYLFLGSTKLELAGRIITPDDGNSTDWNNTDLSDYNWTDVTWSGDLTGTALSPEVVDYRI